LTLDGRCTSGSELVQPRFWTKVTSVALLILGFHIDFRVLSPFPKASI
jgi:hypothetical protein